jgi:hypothetical protein
MAPKVDKAPPTFVLGRSKVSEALIAEFVVSGFIKKGKVEPLVPRLLLLLAPKRLSFSGIFSLLDFVFH